MTRRMAPTTKGPRGQDETIWQSLVDGSACPICRRGEPLDIVADLPASWATAARYAPVRWYVCVTAKQHVIEPFELREPARSQFWNDVLLVAEALQRASGAVKVNYEIHGNSIPHLHCHIYPIVREDDAPAVEVDRDKVERPTQQIQVITTAIQGGRDSDTDGGPAQFDVGRDLRFHSDGRRWAPEILELNRQLKAGSRN